LAKASPDLSPHLRTQKPHFLTSFQQRKTQFSDACRSSRRENGWKWIVRTSCLFLDGSKPVKKQPKNQKRCFR